MKLIKLGVLSLFFIALLITGMSLFIPSKTRVSRAITLSLPAAQVSGYLSDMRNWPEWNELLQGVEQSQLKATPESITGPDVRIERLSTSDTSITSLWRAGGEKAVHCTYALTAYDPSSTVVQWYFDFQVKWYPWEKFGSILFDRQLGPLMEKSLDQLKKSITAAQ